MVYGETAIVTKIFSRHVRDVTVLKSVIMSIMMMISVPVAAQVHVLIKQQEV